MKHEDINHITIFTTIGAVPYRFENGKVYRQERQGQTLIGYVQYVPVVQKYFITDSLDVAVLSVRDNEIFTREELLHAIVDAIDSQYQIGEEEL